MRLFDVVARYAGPVSKEWFRLMEWLLIVAALSVAASSTDSVVVKALPILSVGSIWLYSCMGYLQKYLDHLGPLREPASLKELLVPAAVALVYALFVLWLAQVIAKTAVEFATTIADASR